MNKQKHISIRIDDKILKKINYIAKYDDRSANGHIMFLINKYIRDFEEQHGGIISVDEKEAEK